MTLYSGKALLCLFVSAWVVHAETTEAILSRLDKAAPSFRGVAADLKMTTFTKVLDDSSVEIGTLKMERPKPRETTAVIDFSAQTDARIISFQDKTVRMFYPKLNEYKDISLGKNGNVLNQFLLLGFGSSGKDLAASYVITNEGVEKVNGSGITRLMLVPKDSQVRTNIDKVAIWIPEGLTYPVQQQFYQGSGNYQLVAYSNVVLNPKNQKVSLSMPSSAKKQKK